LILLITGILLAVIGGIINEPANGKPLLAATLLLLGLAIICGVSGFIRLLYAVLLQGDAPRRPDSPLIKGKMVESAHLDRGVGYHAALPAPHGVPVVDFGTKRVKTAEMANVQSVTENTTKLLDEQ
jgi:hypothetical protein